MRSLCDVSEMMCGDGLGSDMPTPQAVIVTHEAGFVRNDSAVARGEPAR